MINKGQSVANHPHPRRKIPLAVGDVLLDLKGHAYRVMSIDEGAGADEKHGAVMRINPITEEGADDSAGLTRRQRQIAGLLASRATNAEIAASLGISAHTARHHSQRVLEKLGITSRAEVRTRIARIPGQRDAAREGC